MNAWLIAHDSWDIPVLAAAIVVVLASVAWLAAAAIVWSSR